MIDENRLIGMLERHRWKSTGEITELQAQEIKFGNEMLDVVFQVINEQPRIRQTTKSEEEIFKQLSDIVKKLTQNYYEDMMKIINFFEI